MDIPHDWGQQQPLTQVLLEDSQGRRSKDKDLNEFCVARGPDVCKSRALTLETGLSSKAPPDTAYSFLLTGRVPSAEQDGRHSQVPSLLSGRQDPYSHLCPD